MKIRTLFALTCLTTALACGGDDGTDDGANDDTTGADTTASTTATTTASTTATTTASTTATTTASTTDGTESGTEDTGPEDTGPEDTGPEDSGTDTGPEDSGTTGDISPECQEYCDLYLENCDDGQGGSTPYADEAECAAACAGFDMPGLECRIGHLDGSAVGEPNPNEQYYMTHCPHGSQDGGGVC